MRAFISSLSLACLLCACVPRTDVEVATLLDQQLGFPVLDGLTLCPPETTVMDGNRESVVCAIVRNREADAAPFISEYATLATSSGWSPERIDESRAYFVRTRDGCLEQLSIFLAEGPDGEDVIVFGLQSISREMVTSFGASQGMSEPQMQQGCEG